MSQKFLIDPRQRCRGPIEAISTLLAGSRITNDPRQRCRGPIEAYHHFAFEGGLFSTIRDSDVAAPLKQYMLMHPCVDCNERSATAMSRPH